MFYAIIREGVYLGNFLQPTFSDRTFNDPLNELRTSTPTYYILAVEHHGNYSTSPPIIIHVPAAGGIDPRRTGVRANGAY